MTRGDETPVSNLLDQIAGVAKDNESLEFGQVMDAIGRHSFAALLLITGLIMLVPGPADIPGVPVFLGAIVILSSIQMLIRREHLWIPSWMARQKIRSRRVESMIRWLRRPAGWIDFIATPRLEWMMSHATVVVLAVAAILVAMSTPVLEFIPFSANLAGAAIVILALAMLAHDGILAVASICITLATFALIAFQLMG